MPNIIEKYAKIFTLEARQAYTDRAVTGGGLQALAISWPAEARESGLSETLIAPVSTLLNSYPKLSHPERRLCLHEIATLLGIQLLLPAVPASTPRAKPEERLSAIAPTTNNTTKPAPSKAPPTKNASTPSKKKAAPTTRKTARDKTSTSLRPNPRERINPEQMGLSAPVTVIRGVGPKQAENLSHLGISSIRDLLYHFPRRYDDYSKLKTISQLNPGEEVSIVAKVLSSGTYPTKSGKQLVETVVSDTTGNLRLLWFSMGNFKRTLPIGQYLSISGKTIDYFGRLAMWFPDYEAIDQQQLHTNRIVPVYPLTANVSQRWLRRTQFSTLQFWAPRLEDYLPTELVTQNNLPSLPEALQQIHFPNSQEDLKTAQNRFAFDELLFLQLGVLRQKIQWQQLVGHPYQVSDAMMQKRLDSLPYKLTGAQTRSVAEIRHDLEGNHPMNRLLQGDVGSGKTVVAILAMSIVIQGGAQAALMAPTGILAEQHYQTLLKLLAADSPNALLQNNQIRLLTGDSSATEKNEILQDLQSGRIKALVGTHALIEDPVLFQNLQLVIVDEQHRFGVAQRAALRQKGDNPHLLVMTATPIPRSLQMSLFGDLDVSLLNEQPAGRIPIETTIAFPNERREVYDKIDQEIDAGHQAFIIYPLVEQDEETEINENKAAVDEHARLQREVFPHRRVGLVHGRLKPSEKDAVMLAFRNKEYDILVSTSVIEVGVDIPNASIMLIESANRFGLAQLHQFRGRVGRGNVQSYCILIPENETALEDNKRLQAMLASNDGFALAEQDLKDRGPGDFLGTRQAGFARFKMAMTADQELMAKARKLAEKFLSQDPELTAPQHRALRTAMETFWPSTKTEGELS